MADRTLHPEFRDRHEKSNYPFSDNAILSAVNVEIFVDTFIDASIYAIGGAENAALKSVVIGRDTATIYIGDDGDDAFVKTADGQMMFIPDGRGAAVGIINSTEK